MTREEFQNDIRAGIPDRLPAAKPYDKRINHAPKRKNILSDEEKAAKDAAFQEQGLVVASGLLGGESIVGVILAFVSVGLSLLG